MKAVIAEQAVAGEERVAGVVRGATVDCRWEGIIGFTFCYQLMYRVFFLTGPPLKVLSTKKLL